MKNYKYKPTKENFSKKLIALAMLQLKSNYFTNKKEYLNHMETVYFRKMVPETHYIEMFGSVTNLRKFIRENLNKIINVTWENGIITNTQAKTTRSEYEDNAYDSQNKRQRRIDDEMFRQIKGKHDKVKLTIDKQNFTLPFEGYWNTGTLLSKSKMNNNDNSKVIVALKPSDYEELEKIFYKTNSK